MSARRCWRRRVRIQMAGAFVHPQGILDHLQKQLFSDPTARAVWLYDESLKTWGWLARPGIPVPRSPDEVKELLKGEAGELRAIYRWESRPGVSSVLYMDLSGPTPEGGNLTQKQVAERSNRFGERVRFTKAEILADSLWAEILGDSTVQTICILDECGNSRPLMRRHEQVPSPRSIDEAARMLFADSGSTRRIYPWEPMPGYHCAVYISLSNSELNKHFRRSFWPLLRNVIALTTTGFVIISAVCIFAYRLWGRATRQRRRALLQQQGLQAEHVLTAAVLAHEIRNPLAALRFQLHSLRRNAADVTRVAGTADTIDKELQRIQQLVQDYLCTRRRRPCAWRRSSWPKPCARCRP